tara:strand:+ start:953 stop:1603 length:651 start_codon:yes stop_codon:yes gene_type:complete
MQMYNSEHLQEKWAPILDYDGLDPIKDSHRRAVTAVLLENQEKELREERSFLSETPNMSTNSGSAAGFSADATAAGPVAGFDPVLISLIRRSMPNLVAYDLAGVQPMNGPTGLIFAMRSRYKTQSGSEAFFGEADTAFSDRTTDSIYPLAIPTPPLVLVLLLSKDPTPVYSTQLLLKQTALTTTLVRVCVLMTLKHSDPRLAIISTRWHSQSRRSL